MTDSPKGQHAGSGRPSSEPPVPEPSFAEKVRTLLHVVRVGTLSSMSQRQAGYPFGSLMPFAVDEAGRPLFLISSMAMHTQNLKDDSHASLLVTQPDVQGEPLGASRATIIGNALPISDDERESVRALYLAQYENAKYWVDYDDFAFYRMDVVDVYFVGGFGVMGWVSADDYQTAHPDPLAESAPRIIEHMNADHAEALLLLAKVHAGIEATEAKMTSVDRLGFHLRLKTSERMRGARIAFTHEVHSAEETRAVLVEMVGAAR